MQIDGVEHDRLGAAQPERIHGLQQLRVPQGSERALPSGIDQQLDTGIGCVEQALDLVISERTTLPVAFELKPVGDRVPWQAHLRRELSELPIADLHPVVQRAREVIAEPTDRTMIGAHRRERPSTPAGLSGELVDIRDAPLPRRFVHKVAEPHHGGHPIPDGLLTQASGQLLLPPAFDHRVEDLLLRVRQRDVRRRSDQPKRGRRGPKSLH